MKVNQNTANGRLLLVAMLCLAAACSPDSSPQTGSQTNWLRSCTSDEDCGDLSCHCGACTITCASATACGSLPDATCETVENPGVVALCGGTKSAQSGLCLRRCGEDTCGEGQACVAGICSEEPDPQVEVAIDPNARLNELVGFGATLAYAENEVLQHPKAAELFDAMFADLGLDILRLRNRHGYVGDDDLATARAIVDAATASLERAPTLMLTSWSPPPALKASAATTCAGNADSCTLVRQETGSFDYVGYGQYWRDSLDAYAAVGVNPNFISLQNNPDYVPTAIVPGEGCRFLPTEATETVMQGGTAVELAFPGFSEALQAVTTAISDMDSLPKIVAPEVSTYSLVDAYVRSLDPANFDAIGHHLYGSAAATLDLTALASIGQLAQSLDKPLFQTETQAEGLDLALFLHHTLTSEGVSAYLHHALVGGMTTTATNSEALVAFDAWDYTMTATYQALRHYAFYTDPGWQRVEAKASAPELLTSAWLSPSGDRLTIVCLNPGASRIDARVDYGDWGASRGRVLRTTFEGDERFADLGELSAARIVQLPPSSVVTLVLEL